MKIKGKTMALCDLESRLLMSVWIVLISQMIDFFQLCKYLLKLFFDGTIFQNNTF